MALALKYEYRQVEPPHKVSSVIVCWMSFLCTPSRFMLHLNCQLNLLASHFFNKVGLSSFAYCICLIQLNFTLKNFIALAELRNLFHFMVRNINITYWSVAIWEISLSFKLISKVTSFCITLHNIQAKKIILQKINKFSA